MRRIILILVFCLPILTSCEVFGYLLPPPYMRFWEKWFRPKYENYVELDKGCKLPVLKDSEGVEKSGKWRAERVQRKTKKGRTYFNDYLYYGPSLNSEVQSDPTGKHKAVRPKIAMKMSCFSDDCIDITMYVDMFWRNEGIERQEVVFLTPGSKPYICDCRVERMRFKDEPKNMAKLLFYNEDSFRILKMLWDGKPLVMRLQSSHIGFVERARPVELKGYPWNYKKTYNKADTTRFEIDPTGFRETFTKFARNVKSQFDEDELRDAESDAMYKAKQDSLRIVKRQQRKQQKYSY